MSGIGDKLVLFFQWISTFFAGFAIGFVRDWRLTLVLMGLVPFLALGGALMSWVSGQGLGEWAGVEWAGCGWGLSGWAGLG